MKISELIGNLLMICPLLLNNSCYADLHQIKLQDDPDQMEKQLLRFIPLGSSTTDAEKIMKDNGFQCTYRWDTPYSKWRKAIEGSSEDRSTIYKPSDTLSCETTQSFIIAYTRRVATIAFEKQLVTNIVASIESVGP
jgi:hypothetical protein